MEICGRKLKPFPVLLVRHRSREQHNKWVREFIAENEGYLEEQREVTRDELRNHVEDVKNGIRGEGCSEVDDEEAIKTAIQRDFLQKLLENDGIHQEKTAEKERELDKLPF